MKKPMLKKFKKIQENCDKKSYFIRNKMYEDLKPMEIIKHNSFHLMNLVAKISAVCEQEEHNQPISLEKIKNEVIPDLIIYALQFANALNVDLDQKFKERLEFVKNKYSLEMLPKKDQEEVVQSLLETKWGVFNIFVWKGPRGQESVALVTPALNPAKPVTVRIHSECLTGDNFGSLRCDCGKQKENALKLITKSGNGMLIYHRQEGRGIGLFEKIKAYRLQAQGMDTYDANIKLGWKPDERTYKEVADILASFGIKKIRLLTNNSEKIEELIKYGIKVTKMMHLPGEITEYNRNYLKTKIEKLGHDRCGVLGEE